MAGEGGDSKQEKSFSITGHSLKWDSRSRPPPHNLQHADLSDHDRVLSDLLSMRMLFFLSRLVRAVPLWVVEALINQVPREPLYLQGGFPPSPTAGEHCGAVAEGSGEVSDSDLVQGDWGLELCKGPSLRVGVCRFCNAHYSMPPQHLTHPREIALLEGCLTCHWHGEASARQGYYLQVFYSVSLLRVPIHHCGRV